jgi:hypothetical protein
MVKGFRLSLFGFVLVVGILFSLNLVSADYASCALYTNTTEDICTVTGGASCQWKTSAQVDWCPYNETGCCTDIGCWDYDSTNQTACETNNGNMNCTWDPYMTMWYSNGTQKPSSLQGACMMEWTGDMTWEGMTDGPWNYNGDKAACLANQYLWKANDANQNTWCNIKTLGDAQMENSLATLTDVGCCEQNGCWNYDTNETACAAVLNQSCTYENSSYGGGWCMTKQCSDMTNNVTCNYLAQTLFMPCSWNESDSECLDSYGGGGFGAYNDTDSCFDQGGWYNEDGECVQPTGGATFGGGGGGFMFAGDAHCWFADNQPTVCNNVTGCAYCVAGTGDYGIGASNSSNICSGKSLGFCEGHDTWDTGAYDNANNTANLACTDILVKAACKYGPLPNCKWTNSSINFGAYCSVGTSSERESAPPVPYCEHPDSKNNYTICSQLIEEFMMPCTWDNASAVVKNCTFNSGAVFGSGEIDVGSVGSETACTASGGTWQTEYYVDGAILKQDSWCEMTGFFDIDNGGQEANKANCDTSCWACEFQSNGTAWDTVANAEAACVGSALGYCDWKNDTNGTFAYNGLGWCDYPEQMIMGCGGDGGGGGLGDCNTDCENCGFMNDPYSACVGSPANDGDGCKWVNGSADGVATTSGYCVDKSKKVCASDCFSCYSTTDCQASLINCSWDTTSNVCSPDGYTGEICFDGIDNDNDQLIDCSDTDCGFDNFCGGSAIGGDCFAQTTDIVCGNTTAFGGLNCTWLTDTWNTDGWCDMPGANCWKFDGDLATCGTTPGCTNESVGMMGAANMCDINVTKMDDANCWNNYNESSCEGAAGNCQWKNDTWCAGDGAGSDWCDNNPSAGYCDYAPFSDCMGANSTQCAALAGNCTWNEDEYSIQGGWCDVACFNWTLDETQCGNAFGSSGLCEWRDMSATCQPEMFMMMGTMGAGGQSGCWQHDGNETGCEIANVTCTYKNDTYANNGVVPVSHDGWCMEKGEYEHFGDIEGDVHQLAMDAGNPFGQYGPGAEPGVSDEVDIMGMGMRITSEGLNFGAGIFNISDSIICNGRNVGAKMQMNGTIATGALGAGNSSGEFYWYLDTDGSETGSCSAIGDASYAGYEFRISYVARNDSTTGITETKQLMRCSDGTWVATNALVTTNKQMSCGEIGGVMVAVSSQDLESFSEYSGTANMRVYMSSVDSSDSRTSPSDYVGPGYYTPGSIDFGFVDCSDPNTKDPKCKNMQKFGFNVFEECMNGVDDNEDGLADCADPLCTFTPKCAGGTSFNFSVNVSDKVAPTVIYNEVDELADGAFMKIDTNEASNMSVMFYSEDSTCSILNTTINDAGTESYQENANFKPFHAMDLIDSATSLGFDLTNATYYYYKIKTCDPSSNCAISACSNFTTKNSTTDKSFIFKLDLPAGYTVDIPALNKTGYNFTETFTINGVATVFDVGIKTNTSVTKNMNFTVHSNCDDDLSIGFYGINVYEPVKIDMSSAFVCDADTNMMGMNSSLKKWNKLIDEMHLGGANDYIQMNLPVAYSSSNTFNFVDDAGAGAQDVDDYVNCESGGTGVTACQVPVSLGL